MAAAGTKPQGNATDEHDPREGAKAAGVKAERNRRDDNNVCFICGKQGHKQWDCPQSQQGEAGKGVHGQSHGQSPMQQQQSTSGPAQHTLSKTTGMAPASATPRANAYKTASKAVVTEIDLLRLKRLRTMTTTTCTFSCRGRRWCQWITGSPRKCSTRFHKALAYRMQRQLFTPFQCSRRHLSCSSGVVIPAPYARVSVFQPGGSGDTSVDTVRTEPHLEALTQHVAGRLAVSGASAAAEVNALVDSGSGITAMSEKLVEALHRQPGMTQTTLTQAFAGHARVATSLGLECDSETPSCPLHLTIDTPWGPVRFTIPFRVLRGGGDVVIIGQKTLREKLGIDVMAQLKASVLMVHVRQDGPGMELTSLYVGEPNVQRRCAAGGDGCHGVLPGR